MNWPAIDWLKVWFALSVALGVLAHWARSYINDPDGTGGLVKYLVGGTAADKGASACMLVTVVGSVLMAYALGLEQISPNPYLLCYIGMMGGYTGDSFFNKTPPTQAAPPAQPASVASPSDVSPIITGPPGGPA